MAVTATNLRFEGVIAALTATGTRLQLDADADTAFPPTERSDLWVLTLVLFFLFFFVFISCNFGTVGSFVIVVGL